MTPAEFELYINARIKCYEDEVKMDNERVGLICAILQNGIPVGYAKKNAKKHRPSDYFKARSEDKKKDDAQHVYDVMNMWCAATGGA